jgi:hypothetical protein
MTLPETLEIQRDLGEQPLAHLMREWGLKSHDLVAASTEQITHKMVTRGCKGRRLTKNIQTKLLHALNTTSGKTYTRVDLFTY